MNEPFIQGEKLYKSFWTRTGLCTVTGVVLAASDSMFLVQSTGRSEPRPQTAPAGWSRTAPQALEHLLCSLGVTLRRVEADTLRLRARIRSTQTMLVQVAQLEEEGAA